MLPPAMLRHALTLAALFLLAQAASAQMIVLKDGTQINHTEFTVQDGKLVRTLTIGDKTATTVLPMANIASMDWPEPIEITDARALLGQGKPEEAIAIIKKAKDFFEVFETVKGTPYREVFFAYVETLSQAGKFEETIKLIPQLRAVQLNDEQKLKLRIIQLDIDRQTSTEYASILAEAQSILQDTNDSGIHAAIWMIMADIHLKKKELEKALMAYLRIPVFYGTQVQRVPDAEMKAAQTLVRMKRYEDAQVFFTRLIDTYKGSAIAEAAEKERAAINGMKNEPEQAEPAAEAQKS
jgi:tetratricopeptide (TPR) repeat protein